MFGGIWQHLSGHQDLWHVVVGFGNGLAEMSDCLTQCRRAVVFKRLLEFDPIHFQIL
jgi:hypothetical protein